MSENRLNDEPSPQSPTTNVEDRREANGKRNDAKEKSKLNRERDYYEEEAVEAATTYYATDEILKEKRAEEQKLEREFEETAIQKFEDPEKARKAYRENIEEVGMTRAREIMDRPEDHFGKDAGEKVFVHPGPTKEGEVPEEKVHELKRELKRIEEQKSILRDRQFEAAEDLPDGMVEDGPRPEPEVINEKIRELEGEITDGSPRKKAERIEELLEKKREAEQLENEVEELKEILRLDGDTLGERVENARHAGKEAKKEFAEALEQAYENPRMAAMEFDSIAYDQGFDEAARTLAYEPEKLGEMKENGEIRWETIEHVNEAGERNAAESYLRATEGSELKAAGKFTLQAAKRTELSLQNAAAETGRSRGEIFRRGGSAKRKRVNQSAEVLQRAQREYNRRHARLQEHPEDHYQEEILEERKAANEQTAEEVKERAQETEEKALRGSAALTMQKRREELVDSLAEVYQNPNDALEEIEKEAFRDGLSTDTEAFNKTVRSFTNRSGGEDPSSFGKLRARSGETTPSDRESFGQKLRRRLTYARYGAEAAEGIVEQGPDLETEEAMRKVRSGAKITGATAVLAAVAGKKAGGYAYGKLKEKVGKDRRQMEVAESLVKYGQSAETYDRRRQGKISIADERKRANEDSLERNVGDEEEPEREEEMQEEEHTEEENHTEESKMAEEGSEKTEMESKTKQEEEIEEEESTEEESTEEESTEEAGKQEKKDQSEEAGEETAEKNEEAGRPKVDSRGPVSTSEDQKEETPQDEPLWEKKNLPPDVEENVEEVQAEARVEDLRESARSDALDFRRRVESESGSPNPVRGEAEEIREEAPKQVTVTDSREPSKTGDSTSRGGNDKKEKTHDRAKSRGRGGRGR